MAASGGRFYRPELDRLRCFAFLAVFLHHAVPHAALSQAADGPGAWAAECLVAAARAGGFGVDLFFVLSSYLITELLLREVQVRGSLRLTAFWVRRALRIWPLYFAFLLAAWLLVPRLSPDNVLPGAYVLPFFLFAANWACTAWGYPPSVAAPLWSISIEEQFYIVWPILLRWLGAARLPLLCLVLLLVASACRGYLVWRDAGHPAIWCNTVARLDPIAAGALLAVYLGGATPVWSVGRRWATIGLGIVVLLATGRFLDLAGPTCLLTYPLVAAASTAILWASLGARRPPAPVRVLEFLGRISYGLYVFHFFAIHWAQSWAGPWHRAFLPALVLTVLLAIASYHAIERPFLALKDRFAVVPSGRR